MGTVLGGIAGIHGHKLTTSTFSLVRQAGHELAPGCIRDGLSQTVIMKHPIGINILNGYDAVLVDYPAAPLVGKVIPSIGNPFIDTRNNFSCLNSFRSAFVALGHLSLGFSQSLFIPPEEPGILNLLSGRQGGKGSEADIYADGFIGFREWNTINFTGKAGVPFTSRAAANSASSNLTFNRTVNGGFNITYLSQLNRVLFNRETKLRIGDTVIPSFTAKSRVSRLFTRFHSTKEGFHCQINSYRHILKNLRVNLFQRWPLLLQLGDGYCLGMIVKRLLFFLPSCFTFSQEMVIQPSALFQILYQKMLLIMSWIDTILKRFKHYYYYSLNTILTQEGAGFHLPAKAGSFLARNYKLGIPEFDDSAGHIVDVQPPPGGGKLPKWVCPV